MASAIHEWHRIVKDGDFDALDSLLADEVVFHSPVVHTPQVGKAVTTLYLRAAFGVFPGGGAKSSGGGSESKFRYVREVVGDNDAVLEFTTEMDGIVVNGADFIRWNDQGRIVDFKVMIRPLKAVNKVHAMMGAMLDRLAPEAS